MKTACCVPQWPWEFNQRAGIFAGSKPTRFDIGRVYLDANRQPIIIKEMGYPSYPLSINPGPPREGFTGYSVQPANYSIQAAPPARDFQDAASFLARARPLPSPVSESPPSLEEKKCFCT